MSFLSALRPALLAVALVPFAGAAIAADTPTATPFTLPALPYATDALDAAIDATTMEIHHGRHHKAYVDNLNGKVAEFPQLASLDIEQIQAQVSRFDTAVRNNAGGHYNHSLFWTVLAPSDAVGEPSAALAARIDTDFGSMQAMQQQVDDAGKKVFGSGWAWVIVKDDGSLAVTSTANQDNPLMDVADEKGTPILGLDVWEHAYYLRYQNKRPEYVSNFWKVVNWKEVSRRYDAAVSAR